MKRYRSLILIGCAIVLCACLSAEPKHKTCTLKDDKSQSVLKLNYDNENVVGLIEYEYKQKFSDKMVKGMSEIEIIRMLESIFKKDSNKNIKVEANYNKRKQTGVITITSDMEDLSDEELQYYKLKRNITVDEIMKKAAKTGYKCEVKK